MNRLFVDHLTVLDFSYLDPVRGIVGESWILDIELSGNLDEQGMVFDFGAVKKTLRQSADAMIDHKLIIAESLQGLSIEESGQSLFVCYETVNGQKIEVRAPSQAIAILPIEDLSLENAEKLLAAKLQMTVPPNVEAVKVNLRTEAFRGAYYHYSHGLKKHDGNCQRIAHGHRSKLEIFTDGQRSQLTEYQWAKKWKDIYIGTKADLQSEETHNGIAHYRFSYCAEQGEFELLLPATSVYLIDTDSTVEWIADHIVTILKQQRPQNNFLVRCYEGINKGAIAER